MATADPPPSQSLFAKEELTEQQRARGADGTGDDQSMFLPHLWPRETSFLWA